MCATQMWNTIKNYRYYTTIYSHYTRQRILLEQIYYQHAVANGNKCIQTREKMPGYSSLVLITPSSYHNTISIPYYAY